MGKKISIIGPITKIGEIFNHFSDNSKQFEKKMVCERHLHRLFELGCDLFME